jgi:hypothetical protein
MRGPEDAGTHPAKLDGPAAEALLDRPKADCQGEPYLVAMLGQDANWVHNVRAAGGSVVLRHGRREVVRLGEVDPSDRAPICGVTAGFAALS